MWRRYMGDVQFAHSPQFSYNNTGGLTIRDYSEGRFIALRFRILCEKVIHHRVSPNRIAIYQQMLEDFDDA